MSARGEEEWWERYMMQPRRVPHCFYYSIKPCIVKNKMCTKKAKVEKSHTKRWKKKNKHGYTIIKSEAHCVGNHCIPPKFMNHETISPTFDW